MNIVYHEYSARNIRVRTAPLCIVQAKYKGSTALNVANKILAQLRKIINEKVRVNTNFGRMVLY